MKRLLIIGLALTVFGTTSIPALATTNSSSINSIESSSNDSTSTITPSSYITWLNQKISKTTGSEKSGFQTVLNQFKSLTAKQQQKFINYMNNPEFIKDAIKLGNNSTSNKLSLDANQSSSNKVLKYNEDISVKVSSDVTKDNSENLVTLYSQAAKIKATYTHAVTCMGIDVLKAVIWIRYSTDGEDVISADDGNAFTATNYFPGLACDWSDVSTDYNSQKAWGTADLSFSFIYKTSVTEFGSCEIGVEGDADRNVDGWVNEY